MTELALCRVQLPASLGAHPDDRGPVVRARLIATHQRVVTVAEHVIGAGVLRQRYRVALVLIEGEAEPREVALERVVLATHARALGAHAPALARGRRVWPASAPPVRRSLPTAASHREAPRRPERVPPGQADQKIA